jgi:hypothetical protein
MSPLPVQAFVSQKLSDNTFRLRPICSFSFFIVECFVHNLSDPVQQDVLVFAHVGENAAEVLWKILPPRDAVCSLTGRSLLEKT